MWLFSVIYYLHGPDASGTSVTAPVKVDVKDYNNFKPIFEECDKYVDIAIVKENMPVGTEVFTVRGRAKTWMRARVRSLSTSTLLRIRGVIVVFFPSDRARPLNIVIYIAFFLVIPCNSQRVHLTTTRTCVSQE